MWSAAQVPGRVAYSRPGSQTPGPKTLKPKPETLKPQNPKPQPLSHISIYIYTYMLPYIYIYIMYVILSHWERPFKEHWARPLKKTLGKVIGQGRSGLAQSFTTLRPVFLRPCAPNSFMTLPFLSMTFAQPFHELGRGHQKVGQGQKNHWARSSRDWARS